MHLPTRFLNKILLLASLAAFMPFPAAIAGPFATWNQDSDSGFDLDITGSLIPSGQNWITGVLDFTSPAGLWEFHTSGLELNQLGSFAAHVQVNAFAGNYFGATAYSFNSLGGYGTLATVGSSSGQFIRDYSTSGSANHGLVTTSFPTGTPDDLSTWTYDIHAVFEATPVTGSPAVPEPSAYALSSSLLLLAIALYKRR